MMFGNNTDAVVAPTCLSGFCHCSLIVCTLDPYKGVPYASRNVLRAVVWKQIK